MPRSQDILPTHYYYDHFKEMVGFVVSMYGDILGASEKQFLLDFDSLSRDAQCLFIRICNRKKTAYCADDLSYSEIENIGSVLEELTVCGWLRRVEPDDYEDVLGDLTKDELIEVLEICSGEPFKKTWKKARLISHALENVSFEGFADYATKQEYFIPALINEIKFLLFMYFGKANDSLTAFALRDLGIISTKKQQDYSARFYNLAEARAGFFYSNAIKALKGKKIRQVDKLANCYREFPAAETEYARDLRNSTLFMLGTHFERQKDQSKALSYYELSDSFECRERLVRILYAEGEKERVESLLGQMMDDPASDEEHLFATDFYSRKFGKQKLGAYTQLLRAGEEISVDEFYRGSPEFAALRHYKKTGWKGIHAENDLWNAVFGLLFWEELFEKSGSLSGAFDYLPHLLKNRQFHTRHAEAISKKLQLISEGSGLELILSNFKRCKGEPNGIFGWYDGLKETLVQFVSHSNAMAIASILKRMTEDYHGMSDGFPDLMIYKSGQIKLIEVKAEGDQIRRRQLVRFNQLRSAGFDVEILRVDYHVDPDQVYVVLDVETTGGRPPFDRVTEVGAVKVQNGRVIDEWASLINPEKRISSFITELTGITNEMVSTAPVFAEIADELALFMDGCVFVAHNVNFDYGFIASEFRRLEMPFRFPKLCTCSLMRKHYQGHQSYGLGNLCREYGISLASHHRALCDAKAAAELLCLINEKRLGRATAQAA